MIPYYEEGGITIYHGDWLEVLGELILDDPPDLILADPNFEDWECLGGALDKPMRDGFLLTFSRQPETSGLVERFSRHLEFREALVWYDPQPIWVSHEMAVKHHEDILVFRKGTVRRELYAGEVNTLKAQSKGATSIGRDKPGTDHWYEPRERKMLKSVLEFPRDLSAPLGRWQKPLGLMTTLLRAFCEHLVLDPFCGSGTTLRAAKDLGLSAIGIEIEEKYCEIAAKRLSQGVLPFGGVTHA